MPPATTTQKALHLRELHTAADAPLVLVNVWDAASARIVEDAGFPAIATGSAGISFALGYADGQHIPPAEMIAAVARITRVVNVPVSADVEAGYDDAAATARALINAGAVGMNLEDMEGTTLVPLDQQLAKIRTVRAVAAETGVPIVLNARTDIYLGEVGDPATRLNRTIERLQAFVAAGADCVFVPGVRDVDTIAALVKSVNAPLNILGTVGTPSIPRLHELGVRRVSVGSGPMRATMALTRRIAIEMRDHGTYDAFTQDTIPYAAANAIFES